MVGDTMAKSLCEQIIDTFTDNEFRQKAEESIDSKNDPHLWFQGLQYPTEFEENMKMELNEVFGKINPSSIKLVKKTPTSFIYATTIEGIDYEIKIVHVYNDDDGDPMFEIQFSTKDDILDKGEYPTLNKFHIVTTLSTVAKAMEETSDLLFKEYVDSFDKLNFVYSGLNDSNENVGIDKRLRVYDRLIPRIIDSTDLFKNYKTEHLTNQENQFGDIYSNVVVTPKKSSVINEMLGSSTPADYKLITKSNMMGISSYRFETEIEDIRYEIIFTQIGKRNNGPIFVVSFDVHRDDLSKIDSGKTVTNRYQMVTILSTVVKTMEEVTKDNLTSIKPEIYFKYQGANEEHETGLNKRMKVYDRLIPRIIKSNSFFNSYTVKFNSDIDDDGEHYTVVSVIKGLNESEVLDYKFRRILYS